MSHFGCLAIEVQAFQLSLSDDVPAERETGGQRERERSRKRERQRER